MRVIVPVREPAAVGVKVALIVQVALGATGEPVQVSADFAKSPAIAMLEMFSADVPVLVTVTDRALLVVPTS